MIASGPVAGLIVLAGGALILAAGHRRRHTLGLDELLGLTVDDLIDLPDSSEHDGPPSGGSRAMAAVRSMEGRIGAPLRALGARSTVQGIERELLLAGMAGKIRADEVLGMQAIASVVGVTLGVALRTTGLLDAGLAVATTILLAAAGAMLPRTILRRRAQRRQRLVHARVSDALDLLTMSVEAGLAFDAALATVAETVPAPLGQELSRSVAEMGLGLSRSEALDNLRRRNDSAALDAFVVAVSQADSLGTPLGRVLAGQSAEARSRRRQEARERAGALPVRILLPTVLLVFPPTFVILLGPAAMSIRGAF